MEKIFLTTTLPYINGDPHIGHLLEFVQADAIARYLRTNNDVRFNVGIDEHGLKVYKKAQDLNIDVQEYCNTMSVNWKVFLDKFNIGYDNFYRTTSQAHKLKVHDFWNKCLERDDLYKKNYTGLYCIGCESFKLDKELVNGKCQEHDIIPEKIEEENWFFRTSKYNNILLKWFDKNLNFLTPVSKRIELRNIIKNAEDLSVSRLKKNVPWGISVPNDDTQIIYCWYEALLNYLFSAEEYWLHKTIQISGPDNLRWQGHIFQAFLASAGLPHTQKLLVHGMVLDSAGKKMSKSVGNVIDPLDQLNKFGLDAVRYYSLAGLTTFGDGCWSESDLVSKYNTDLANDFGNLLTRTVHLVKLKNVTLIEVEREFAEIVSIKVNDIKTHWDNYEISKALHETNALCQFGNKYINSAEPWSSAHFVSTLSNLYHLLFEITQLYKPVLSYNTISTILASLRTCEKIIAFKKLDYGQKEESKKEETPRNRKKVSAKAKA